MATAKEQKAQEQQAKPADQPRQAESVMVPYRRGELTPSAGWEPFARLREEFDRLFNQLSWGWPGAPIGRWEGGWGLDVREDDNTVVVRAEAPGFEPADFDLQVRGDHLVLRAAHKAEEKDEGYREWRRREFYRSVPLPPGVNADKVTATYRNGVLTVTLPRAEGSKTRRITVQG
jgi:HSP20 family protein